MKLVAENTHRKDNGDDALIPLINIVFLMLIFFMVAGQISKSDAAFVSPPESISEAYVDDEALQIEQGHGRQSAGGAQHRYPAHRLVPQVRSQGAPGETSEGQVEPKADSRQRDAEEPRVGAGHDGVAPGASATGGGAEEVGVGQPDGVADAGEGEG